MVTQPYRSWDQLHEKMTGSVVQLLMQMLLGLDPAVTAAVNDGAEIPTLPVKPTEKPARVAPIQAVHASDSGPRWQSGGSPIIGTQRKQQYSELWKVGSVLQEPGAAEMMLAPALQLRVRAQWGPEQHPVE